MSSAFDSNVIKAPVERAIFSQFPALRPRVPWVGLADLPTPVERLPARAELAADLAFVKRDDLTAQNYGGNKVRTLEVLFADALARGAQSIVACGAYGSNHAVATALHAPSVGLSPRALLFPQPPSQTALDNLKVVIDRADVVAVPHWSCLPLTMWWAQHGRHRPVSVMLPGGATPWGALGYVSAALELGMQIDAGELPRPARIVVGVGSTCTSAGLLAGLALAARLGIGFKRQSPLLVSVRVTPWPITSRFRIVGLARRTSRLLARLLADPGLESTSAALHAQLQVEPDFLGEGYGIPTEAGYRAMRRFGELGLPAPDTTYSAKAAAAFLELWRDASEPILFWSTKSSAALPEIRAGALARAPRAMQRWLALAERSGR